MERVKFLSRIDLFQGMNTEELERIEPVTPIHLYKKGTIVVSPHSEQKALYLVKSGKVRLYKLTDGGRELTIDILGVGNIFGEVGSFTTGTQNIYAVTLEESHICTIDHVKFKRIIREKPDLALRFIEMVSVRLKEVEELLEHMAYASVRKRLLFLLYKLSEKFQADLPLLEGDAPEREWTRLDVELTHQELASLTGSTRETITEILNALAAEGILKKGRLRKPLEIRIDRLKAELTTS